MILIIIALVLLLALAGIIYMAYINIRDKIRGYSHMLFGSSSLIQGMQNMDMEESVTPKSVSSATGLYLPSITKDFPEFHYDEMKSRAENVLLSYLRSVDANNSALLTEGTNELKDSLTMKIQMLLRQEQKEHFQNMKIHRTEINRYSKNKGRCTIVMQSAIEYFHFIEKDGIVQAGKKEQLEQSKYNIEMIYIQDRDTVENLGDSGLGLNCPNCGAPLPGLGAKKCAYCDTPVIEFNIKTWNFSAVLEVS